MQVWRKRILKLSLLWASLSGMAAMPSLAVAQELSELIQVTVDKSTRATGFRPTNRDQYLALDEAPRTRGPLPARADISERFPTPSDQGPQQNCVAWAVGYAARSYYAAKESGGDLQRFENVVSPAYIYNTVNRLQRGGSDCQTPISITAALDLLKAQGAVPLTVMNYRADDCMSQVLPEVLSAYAQRFRLQGYVRVDDEIAIKTQISRGNPVIFAIHLTKDFDTWDMEVFSKQGPFKSTARDGRQHAMVISGYDNARKAYKFINSWSNEWGEGGFGWLDYQAAKALWIEGYVMTVGTAQQALPPTPPVALREQQAVVSPLRLPTVATTITTVTTITATTADSLQSSKPGSTFRDCENCPEMVVIPAGNFMMGSSVFETNRSSGEGPQHRVIFPRNFGAGKFEVTFDEWDACVRERGCAHNPADEGWGRGRRPVINVSWNDAKQYTQWLSGKTGKSYRLLAESEWEYVARAGASTPFSAGATITPAQANYNATYSYAGSVTGVPKNQTVTVGEFSANPIGLHDVHGNVYEWTEDCSNNSYQDAPDDGSAWKTGDCSLRIMRGGSWINFPRDLRSAARGRMGAALRYNFIGFRVARTD